MGFILIEIFRRFGIEVLSTARVQEAIEPIMFIFFVTRDLAVRLVASAVGLVASAPVGVPIPLGPLVATLVVAFISPITFLLAFIFVGLPRLL